MKYTLKILRGDIKKQYFEEFELEYVKDANVVSALMQIQKRPINKKGQKVAPVSFEVSCLEEACGVCSVLINGYPRQACSALIKPLIEKTHTIVLAPLSKFYIVRDLIVDRKKMFDQLKKLKIWIETNQINPNMFGVKIGPSVRDALYILSKCMMCGCCIESCPQYNSHSDFMGPFAILQIDLFNKRPTKKSLKDERLPFIVQKGGIEVCGNAQNCQKVCPKEIPITESVASLGKEATKFFFQKLFFKKKSEKELKD